MIYLFRFNGGQMSKSNFICKHQCVHFPLVERGRNQEGLPFLKTGFQNPRLKFIRNSPILIVGPLIRRAYLKGNVKAFFKSSNSLTRRQISNQIFVQLKREQCTQDKYYEGGCKLWRTVTFLFGVRMNKRKVK